MWGGRKLERGWGTRGYLEGSQQGRLLFAEKGEKTGGKIGGKKWDWPGGQRRGPENNSRGEETGQKKKKRAENFHGSGGEFKGVSILQINDREPFGLDYLEMSVRVLGEGGNLRRVKVDSMF